MKQRLSKLLSGNRKNLVVLSGGTFVSQLIPFVISPFLTRLYSPEQFAVLELVLRITSLFAVIATLRFDIAIPLPKEDRKAASLFLLALLSSLGVSILCLVLFILFRRPVTAFLNNAAFDPWLLYLPILIFFSGLYQTGTNMLLRLTRYARMTVAKITDSFINGAGKIILGLAVAATTVSLILPSFFAAAVVSLIPLIAVRKYLSKHLESSRASLKSTFKEYIEFPKVNLPNAIIDVLQISLVVFLLSHYFGSAALGLYALKLRVLKTPSIFIGNSAGQIFYQTASLQFSNGQSIKKLYFRYLAYLAMAGIGIFLPFLFLGPLIFEVVFGNEWTLAGELARITAAWMFFSFLASALSYVPVVLKKQSRVLALSSVNFGLVIASLICGAYFFGDFFPTIQLLAAVETVYFVVVNCWYYYIVVKSDRVDVKVP